MIHKYKLSGHNIVLDVNSGSVFSVDEITCDIIDFLDATESPRRNECLEQGKCPEVFFEKLAHSYTRSEIDEAFGEVCTIYNDGCLFSADDEIAELKIKAVNAPIKSLCLNVAHDCNMRCEYCFADKGGFGGAHKLMPFEVGRSAIDFMLENSDDREILEVDFFGGEPLMNLDVVKQIVEYARGIEKEHGKHFNFTITTNGLLLNDDTIDYINREMSNVVLSLDGRKEVNDGVRFLKNGEGSYDAVFYNIKKLAAKREELGLDYYVRGTFTNKNLDFAKDVFELHKLGFKHISIEPVVADPKEAYAISQKDIPKIFEEYEELAEKVLRYNKRNGEEFDFFHFTMDLEESPCIVKIIKGCGSGNEYIAVTPDGDIYPCHQMVGVEKYKMGNVVDGTFNKDLKMTFANTHIFMKPDCVKCWARFFCCGGCNANNYQFNGDLFTPNKFYCILQKKRIECALLLKASV